jgi:gliding motility-associated-like protein
LVKNYTLRKRLHILLASLTVFSSVGVFAQPNKTNLEFIENKGQWDKQVRYKGDMNGGAFFLRSSGVTVLLHNQEDYRRIAESTHGHSHDDASANRGSSNILRSHAYAVDFVGANPRAALLADKPLNTYNNYYIGEDPAKWASNCKIYQAVTYKDIYPNIDARYYTSNGQLKYDLIVHPGGDVNRIAMKYDGVSSMKIKNEQLLINTTVGDVKELAPYTYQTGVAGRVKIDCRYKLRDNILTFNVDDYDRKSTLVIDPGIVFVTFTGSSADNWGFTATYGNDGSFYAGGIVFGDGFPVSTGAFQGGFQNGDNTDDGTGGRAVDIGIMKFNASGSDRLYATYLGGGGNEQPHSLVVDGAGNLVVAGRTNSNNYPLVPANNRFGPNGGRDIIITRLNPTGTALLGSIRIGGSGDDGVNIKVRRDGAQSLQQYYGDDARSEVILDRAGNVVMAGCTRSGDFRTTPGSFQPFSGGGSQDGVLIKLTPNLNSVLFSSFIGGSGNDAAYVLAINPLNGDINVAGGTESNNLRGTSPASLFPSNQGGIDGFMSVISPDGSTIRQTTYMGTSGTDQVYGIQFDRKGFPYVMGTTTGNWPQINATYGEVGGKQFIAKVQPDFGSWIFSTRFGTNTPLPNLSPTAFLVDRCENVYVSGWGGNISAQWTTSAGTTGMSVTGDALQTGTDGRDLYFFVLAKNAQSRLFASFFGQFGGLGEHVDGGTSRFDQNGVIYQAVCANCFGGALFPTQPPGGVWAASNGTGTGGCNLAAIKIEFNLAGVGSGVQAAINSVKNDTVGCLPLTVDFSDTVSNAQVYEWNFGDGSPSVTTPPNTPVSHTYTSVGTFRVRLVATDLTTCNERDTSFVNIVVRDDAATPLGFNVIKLDPCDSFKYQFDNTSIPAPGKVFTDSSFVWDFGDGSPKVRGGLTPPVFHQYQSAGVYNVTMQLIDTNFCNFGDPPVTQIVRVAPFVRAIFETPASGCIPYTASFNNTSLAGTSFIWDFGDGTSSTDVSPTHLYAIPGQYAVVLIANDPGTCNKSDTSRPFIITVSENPEADFNFLPIIPEENSPTNFFNNSIGATNYVWDFGDGTILRTIRRDTTVRHQYNKTAAFNACLTAINQFGCRDTACLEVRAIIRAKVGVPNAFTPGRADDNGIVKVLGFGIDKMTFRIYNRWGQKIFESTDVNKGWDGRFKGQIQPMDVYTYTLDVQFSDGSKQRLTGDITLLR